MFIREGSYTGPISDLMAMTGVSVRAVKQMESKAG